MRRMRSGRYDQLAFFGVTALLFAASATVTIVWCTSMATMSKTLMCGDWPLSMTWMRMPGQTWPQAAASFVGMWFVMMVAMMLPALTPMLLRYRRAVDSAGGMQLGWLTMLVGMGYFFVWTTFGILVYPAGVALTSVVMQLPALARAIPVAAGVVVMFAGALQFTAWKARQLACCRAAPGKTLSADAYTAWRHGLHLGLRCCYACCSLTLILLMMDVMELYVMAGVATAITLERLTPAGERVARFTGTLAMAAGIVMITSATLLR